MLLPRRLCFLGVSFIPLAWCFHLSGTCHGWLRPALSLQSNDAAETLSSDMRSEAGLLDRSGGCLYRTSVFSKEEFASISQDLSSYKNQLCEESFTSIATGRLGAIIPINSETARIFAEGSLLRLVQQLAGSDYKLRNEVPVEIRSYQNAGAAMSWHVDDVLYNPPQVEIVWTLENTSDCETMWKRSGDIIKSIETEPNSVLILRAGGPTHCVTSLKRGRRLIVKCVYARQGAEFEQSNLSDQFMATKKKTRKRKR